MRIAHITDLHLRHHLPGTAHLPRRRSRAMTEVFAAAVTDAGSRGADVIAVTGDLVDIPDYLFDHERIGDEAAWDAVLADYQLIADILDASGLPWIVLPGNHDSHRVMVEVFGERPRIVDHGGVRFISFWDREEIAHAPQRILAERRRFQAAISDPDPTPQVHLQHFVITPELNEGYPHTYVEGAQLRDAMSDSVVLSLSGHYHRGTDPAQHGATLFSVTPALCENPHPYRIFDLSADGEVTWEEVQLGLEPAPAAFLDRDGCINTLSNYHSGPEAMELLPGAASGIRRLRAAGYRIVVVTNQTCVGLGNVTPTVMDEVHDRMALLLAREGAEIDAIHASVEAGAQAISDAYRDLGTHKPAPTMLVQAAAELNLDLSRSFMVGDRATDVAAGQAAGVTPLLVRTGDGRKAEAAGVDCVVVDDLAAVAEWILNG